MNNGDFVEAIAHCCEIVFIVRRHMNGESVESLAKRYNLSQTVISEILNSKEAKALRDYAEGRTQKIIF